jgi:predicted dinucleotide-binding enzyme
MAPKYPGAKTGTFSESAFFGEALVLAVKGIAAADVLRMAEAANLAGKTIMDATNPIADGPPLNGVLPFFTTHDQSLLEKLQTKFARLTSSRSSIRSELSPWPIRSILAESTMFICGKDEAAKKSVIEILDQFGWESADMGGPEAARAIEPLCMLWCLPGFTHNEWTHAFKLLKR